MGKLAKNLSLLRRADNRAVASPPAVDNAQRLLTDAAQSAEAPPPPTPLARVRRSRRERLADEKRAQRDEGQFLWSNIGGKLFTPAHVADQGHKMNSLSIFKILLSIRAASALWSIILDCDEVYNYWEPLHYLLYGHGFQTWEYSLLKSAGASKTTLFYLMRVALAALGMLAEWCAYEAAAARLGNSIASFYAVLTMFSVGVFNAGAAFLPSSFGMTMHTFALAAWLRERWAASIACTALGALLGWPFCAVLGAPIAVEMLVVRARRLALRFFVYALGVGGGVLAAMAWLDSYYYGKLVIAPLNIVLYNVFSKHGPNLYGVESVAYYVKNLFLNWNFALAPAIASLALAAYVYVRTQPSALFASAATRTLEMRSVSKEARTLRYWYRFMPVALMALSACIWLGIFFAQPHKEERFLFPAFPLIAILAAVGLEAMLLVAPVPRVLAPLCLMLFVGASLSRGYALHRNYAAATDTYKAFHDHILINTKSFSKLHVRFLRSAFRGILPAAFGAGGVPAATRALPDAMNDANREEPSRYVPLASCDFLVDLDTGVASVDEPDYASMPQFNTLTSKPFLLAARSHPIYRAFYVPFTDHRLRFGSYKLLQRVTTD